MEDEVIGMIRDNFRQLNETCQGISEKIDAHIEKDEDYWKKIDHQDGQISMLKLLAGAVGGSFAVWEGVKSIWR